jgi:hypothetical protein
MAQNLQNQSNNKRCKTCKQTLYTLILKKSNEGILQLVLTRFLDLSIVWHSEQNMVRKQDPFLSSGDEYKRNKSDGWEGNMYVNFKEISGTEP